MALSQSSDSGTTTDGNHTPARTWASLPVLLLPALLVAMDISILFIAGPAVAADLAPSASQWLWMMDIYSFVMAGLLITMGYLGDRIGRRRLLLLGAAAFGIGSFIIAFAPTAEIFIAARALLGIGAATLSPSTLALIRTTFTHRDHRRGAIGAWTAAFAGGAVAGPIVGGLLLEHYWWGSVFLINVPVMLLLLIGAPLLIPESRDPQPSGFDLPGAALSLVGIIGVVYAGKRFAEHGAETWAFAALAGGVAVLAAALLWMRRARHPLIDLELFRRAAFSAALATNAVTGLVLTGVGLLTFTFLQTVHGMSPLTAAVLTLPTLAGTVGGATLASWLARHFRPAPLVVLGFLISAAAFASISITTRPDSHAAVFIGGYTVLTLGVGMLGTLATSLVLDTAPSERASAAAGTSETGMVLGEAFGIAAFGTIATTIYRRQMSDHGLSEMPEVASETVNSAFAVAEDLPEGQAASLIDLASDAFTHGITVVTATSAIVMTLAAVIIGIALRMVPRTSDAAAD